MDLLLFRYLVLVTINCIKAKWLHLHVHESIEVSTIQLQKIEVKLKRHKLIWNIAQDFANSGVIRGEVGA